jgi:hypothetical protein
MAIEGNTTCAAPGCGAHISGPNNLRYEHRLPGTGVRESDTKTSLGWVFLIDEGDAPRVEIGAEEFWPSDSAYLDISVEMVIVADFLGGRKGKTEEFSVPLGDRLARCETCNEAYAAWSHGLDPCQLCGMVPIAREGYTK